ncbi:MAG: hypothetical protein N2560_05580, partial [Ignavibacteria bacterium]|nr:hypothetical protein [Ignavibacteria bacterium]
TPLRPSTRGEKERKFPSYRGDKGVFKKHNIESRDAFDTPEVTKASLLLQFSEVPKASLLLDRRQGYCRYFSCKGWKPMLLMVAQAS